MDIYVYDGKALQYDGKCISPKANGETWVLNENCSDFSSNGFTINFISNNMNFTNMSIQGGITATSLYYDDTPVATANFGAIGYSIFDWENQAYRTITFLEAPAGNLLTWLQANGTKQ